MALYIPGPVGTVHDHGARGRRRDAGVSIAEVNLKFIWDVVSQIKVGERGYAS